MKAFDPYRNDPRYRKPAWNWRKVDDHSPLARGPDSNAQAGADVGGGLAFLFLVALVDSATGCHILKLAEHLFH